MNKILIPFLLSAIFLNGCVTTNPREESCKTLDAFNGTYDGGCRNGLAHGKGAYLFSGGDRYVGDFVDGYRTGHGTLALGNGKKLTGRFVRGEFKSGERGSQPQASAPPIINTSVNEPKRADSGGGPVSIQADSKKVAEMAEGLKSKSVTFEPIDKAAYYLGQRKYLKNNIALFNEVILELPEIEKQSVASGAKKFPDIKSVVSKQDYAQKFLHNASGLAEIDRPAYFQLLRLNLAKTASNFTNLLSVVDSVLAEYSPEFLARANSVMEDNERIDESLLAHKNSGNREMIKRAYDLASTDQQRRKVEAVVIESLKDKQLIFNTRMEASGNVKSSGGSELGASLGLGRSVSATVTSLVKYEAMLDTSIYKPDFDYKVKAKVRIEVPGRVRGTKPCGFLLLSNCEFDDADVKYFDQPVELALNRNNGHKDRGETSIDWDSVSGGSGLASGMLFGGTIVFSATDGPRLKVIDIAVESTPRSVASATESTPVKVKKGAQHPIDTAFLKAAGSTKVSKSTVGSGVSLDMSNAMGDAKRKIDTVDEKVQQNRSRGSGSSASSSTSSNTASVLAGSWKLIKQYEGGFSDFGMDTRRTIFLIKCGKGAEHKMYQNDRGKWGAVGGVWNNAASSLEEAAIKQCS